MTKSAWFAHIFRSAMLAGAVMLTTPMTAPAHAAKPPVCTPAFSNLALEGHDAVAHFKQGKAVKGDKAFATTWNGAEFRFATGTNLKAFVRQPASYLNYNRDI